MHNVVIFLFSGNSPIDRMPPLPNRKPIALTESYATMSSTHLPDYLPDYAKSDLISSVANALREDIGDGDITAALIPASTTARGKVITREAMVLCGQAWVEEVFRQVDASIRIDWAKAEGELAAEGDTLFSFSGPARGLLTGERTALNFLQMLSGTATLCRQYAERVSDTSVKLLDTRKTIPGLRNAQKYAVTCGGCFNHRIGLYDAFLIKENHIATCGGIEQSVVAARGIDGHKPVEIEVENLDELSQALNAGADIIMLDNFSIADLKQAVNMTGGKAKLEASGNITDATLREIASTGVDYISIGALTKHVRATDLSMRFEQFQN